MPPNGYRLLDVSLLALLAGGLAAVPGASANDFTTAKGRVVAMPTVESMTCEEMEATLAAIDLTRYRENAPKPHDTSDGPLFVYEKKLARIHYHTCVTQTSGGAAEKELLRRADTN